MTRLGKWQFVARALEGHSDGLEHQILDVLRTADGPLSTYQLLKCVEDDTGRLVGYATLFRALESLERQCRIIRWWEKPGEAGAQRKRLYRFVPA